MTSEPAAPATGVDGLPFEVDPHRCFACGTLNEHGLGLTLHVAPQRSWAELALEPQFQGWDGIAHGGIVAAVLDEVMAWSLAHDDDWGVTARMAVEYRRPVPLGAPIRADGWITRSRRRLIETEARLVEVASGEVLATATGVYVAADPSRKEQLKRRYGVVSAGAVS